MNCGRGGCAGTIVDGYCDVCGMAPARPASEVVVSSAALTQQPPSSALTASTLGSSRRATTGRTRTSARAHLGAGLVEIEPVPFRDPADAVLGDAAVVPESRRFCPRCDEPVGRGRDGASGRTSGFCRKCGTPFSFEPQLAAGVVVAGQYEVVGAVAHGGMGWVYLARDRNVSDRWVVLKGLLNSGDHDAMAAALAERRFLAEVEHPNIVKIFNFVQHENSGYIVMEYVGGRSLKQILTARRAANGGEPDPLPPAVAIAYMLEILPALGYLHQLGLLFCDFKIDNVIQTQHSLKLIDLGGVYRIDDPSGAVFGTVGYQAPEIVSSGPSAASDLFTVARTLAVLCFDFRGYQSNFRFSLPGPGLGPGARHATTRFTSCCSRAPRRIPTTVFSRPGRWPTSSTASCARSSAPKRGGRYRRRANCSPAPCGAGTRAPSGARCPVRRSIETIPRPGTWPRSHRPIPSR